MAASRAPHAVAKWVGIGLGCVLALVGSFALAWWQWDRYEAGGTFQNLGYVLQWPLFGVFPAFLVWRVRKLDAGRERPAPGSAESTGSAGNGTGTAAPEPLAVTAAGTTAEPPAGPSLGYVPPRHDPDDEDDPTRAEYNRYLAALHAGEDHDSNGR